MKQKVTKGKIVGLVISLAIAGFFWNIFFPPGGSGANIVLGLFVAIFGVYYLTNYLGGLLDQEIFFGGSKKRIRLYRSLDSLIKDSKNHLSNIKKSKRKRAKVGQKILDDLDKALISSVMVIRSIDDNWSQDVQKIAEQEKSLQQSLDRLELTSHAVFGVERKWRWLHGMPSLFFALLLALSLREFIVEPFQIPSGSMIPTLRVGDHLFVSKFHYGLSMPFSRDPDFIFQWAKPQPGDVIVFKSPEHVGRHAGQPWIKRVVAGPGQTIINHHMLITHILNSLLLAAALFT
jgi:hypothetical protein